MSKKIIKRLLFSALFVSLIFLSFEFINGGEVKAEVPTLPLADVNKINVPEIFAKNAVIYDVSNKDFIYAKSAEESVAMASLTKIITARLFLELNDERRKQNNLIGNVTITKTGPGENQGDRELINGEVWDTEDLIQYMLITSSNVAAESLSKSMTNDDFAFSLLMDTGVKQAGFKSFSFKNSSGLSMPESEYNSLGSTSPSTTKPPQASVSASKTKDKNVPSAYGSAKEIALLFNAIFTNSPSLALASIMPEANFVSKAGRKHQIKNINLALAQIPNIIAAKTGTTDESGANLVFVLDINQQKYIVVILGSTLEERYKDAAKMASSTKSLALSKTNASLNSK